MLLASPREVYFVILKQTDFGILSVDNLLPPTPLQGIFCGFCFAFVSFISVEGSKTLGYNTLTKMASLENSRTYFFLPIPRVRQKLVLFLEAGGLAPANPVDSKFGDPCYLHCWLVSLNTPSLLRCHLAKPCIESFLTSVWNHTVSKEP